jgi:DNA-binding MarR family transcriptional regulator
MKIHKFLSQSCLFVLYRGHASIVEPFQTRINNEGVHLLQALVLTALFFDDREVRPSELAGVLKVSKSNLSHSLRSLEKKGWLKRGIHPRDARGYLFSLTAAGKKKATVLIKAFDTTEFEIERSVGAKNLRGWLESSQTILDRF